MTYLSIIEKLNILFNTMLDFHFILVFSVLLMIFTFMFITKKISVKKYALLMLLSFIVVFGISIISNYEVLSNTFDNFTTIFFGNIYFPSIYVYIGVLVISFISFIVSILNVMLKKIYKVINSIMFVVNNVLFVIILNIIAKNKIDVFSVNSLYTNTSLVAILELSMGLFILWILSLVTIYITNSICSRIGNKKVVGEEVQEEIFDPVLEVSNDIVNDVNSLNDDNIETVLVEDISNNELVEQIDNVIEDSVIFEEATTKEVDVVEEASSVTFNDILNGTIPVTYYDNNYINKEYDLVNPQSVYEDNYNKVKSEVVFNDILIEETIVNEIEEPLLSVEELTKIEKERVSEERLSINTISLNDLTFEEVVNKEEVMDNTNVLEVEDNNYSLDDYKKFIKMLTEIKNHSNGNNINIDDVVALGLINNYSIDDCMMFKNILENNLN